MVNKWMFYYYLFLSEVNTISKRQIYKRHAHLKDSMTRPLDDTPTLQIHPLNGMPTLWYAHYMKCQLEDTPTCKTC